MKRGPKLKPPILKAVAGTDQPSRATELIYDEIEGVPELPPSHEALETENPNLAKSVIAFWDRKLKRYEQRGQNIFGYEDMLYTLCLFEAQTHDKRRRGEPVTAADMNALRAAHESFYDTPAANVKGKDASKTNPFNKHKKGS